MKALVIYLTLVLSIHQVFATGDENKVNNTASRTTTTAVFSEIQFFNGKNATGSDFNKFSYADGRLIKVTNSKADLSAFKYSSNEITFEEAFKGGKTMYKVKHDNGKIISFDVYYYLGKTADHHQYIFNYEGNHLAGIDYYINNFKNYYAEVGYERDNINKIVWYYRNTAKDAFKFNNGYELVYEDGLSSDLNQKNPMAEVILESAAGMVSLLPENFFGKMSTNLVKEVKNITFNEKEGLLKPSESGNKIYTYQRNSKQKIVAISSTENQVDYFLTKISYNNK